MQATPLVLICAAACGRIGFAPSADGDAAVDATGDADGDAAAPQFGPWDAPIAQPMTISSNSHEYGPALSFDGRELYFASRRNGDADIYRATCAGGVCDAPEVIDGMNLAGQEEGEPTLSRDGTTLYLNYETPGARLYMATRATTSSVTWTRPVPVDATNEDLAGYICADFGPDDLRLVVNTPDGQLYETTRASVDAPWGPPQPLGLTGDCGSLRADGLELYWEDDTVPPFAIYRAERAALDQPFGAPERLELGEVDDLGAGDPDISGDGTTLVFVANTGSAAWDVFTTTRQRL